jgi:predicted nucleic acid-binding protein
VTLVVLDSTFVVDHLRGLPAARERWAQLFERGDQPVATELVTCEVRSGLRDADVPVLERLLRPMEFVQPGIETAMLAGRWRSDLRRSGRTLSLADALIAAAAFDLNAPVLTRNVRDFALTPVSVETY